MFPLGSDACYGRDAPCSCVLRVATWGARYHSQKLNLEGNIWATLWTIPWPKLTITQILPQGGKRPTVRKTFHPTNATSFVIRVFATRFRNVLGTGRWIATYTKMNYTFHEYVPGILGWPRYTPSQVREMIGTVNIDTGAKPRDIGLRMAWWTNSNHDRYPQVLLSLSSMQTPRRYRWW